MHWQRHKGGAQHHRVAERLGKRLRGRGRARRRSGAAVRRDGADARRARRADARRLPAPRARRARQVRHASISRSRPTRRSSSKATSSPASAGAKVRSATTPASIRIADDYPVFHLTCVTRRKNPIYLTTVVGIPPMEDYYLGKASERIFLPLIRKTLPEIVDMHFPGRGHLPQHRASSRSTSAIPGHARKIMNAVWGLGQLMFSKTHHRRRQGRRRAERGGGRVDRRHALSTRSATSSSRAGRWTTSTTPAICRPTAARWASTRRASGRRKGSRARGRSGSATTERPTGRRTRCGRRSARDGSRDRRSRCSRRPTSSPSASPATRYAAGCTVRRRRSFACSKCTSTHRRRRCRRAQRRRDPDRRSPGHARQRGRGGAAAVALAAGVTVTAFPSRICVTCLADSASLRRVARGGLGGVAQLPVDRLAHAKAPCVPSVTRDCR